MNLKNFLPLSLWVICLPIYAAENNAAASAISTTTTLDDIVINASVLPAPQRSPDKVSKSIITGKEARSIAGTAGDPLMSLQSLPGVISSNRGSEPAVRGSGPQDNAYYVDDMQVTKVFHNAGISVFNPDLVKDFNLYSAAFAPRYANVTGAVIDVALRNPRVDRIGYKLNASVIGADALVEGPVNDNQSFYFAARRSYVDLFIKSISQDGITVQIPNYADYQGKYLWQLNDTNTLTLNALGALDNLKLNVGSTSNLAQQDPVLSGNIALSDQSHTQGATLDTTLADEATNKLSFVHITSNADNSIASAGYLNLKQDVLRLSDRYTLPMNESNTLLLATHVTHQQTDINANIKNALCTQFNPNCNISNSSQARLIDTINSNAFDLSAQDRLHLNDVLTLIGGMRYSYEDYLRQSYLEPRLGAEWQDTPQTLYTAGWGRHNEMPLGQELSPVFGNPHLSHLRADHSVIGVTHKLDELWSVKSEAYYKTLRNLTVDSPTLNYVNGGSGQAYGLEMLLKKDSGEQNSGWLSVSLAHSSRHNDLSGQSFRYALDQPINATLVANHKLNDGWSLNGKWTIHSGAPYTPINGSAGVYTNGSNIPNYGAINSATLPTFQQLDLRLQREMRYSENYQLSYYIELNNIYQHKNVVGYTYDPSYTTAKPVYSFVLPLAFGVQAEF